ncbi:MAG: response regulator, partial [Gemmatimonadaceae bacterium]
SRPPLVVIADDQEWAARSLESILAPQGYAVLTARGGHEALDLIGRTKPDLVILDDRMPDISGVEVCRRLRSEARIGSATPVIITTAVDVARARRLEAHTAGAWLYCSLPLDGEILLLQIALLVAAKLELARIDRESLIDAATGLYSTRGLALRAKEIGSEAQRRHAPLTCIAFSVTSSAAEETTATTERLDRLAEHVGTVCRGTGRGSDAFGRLGAGEFGIVAAATEPAGAPRIVERLRHRLAESPFLANGGIQSLAMHAGFAAAADFASYPVDAVEMLFRAATALRHLRESVPGGTVLSFDDVPIASTP